jgi:hypothetical protein
MIREEKQKAIDALKISAPIKALTQEEFNDYIQTINKIMDYLEQETVLDKLRAEIETKYGQCSICEYDSDYGGKWYQVGDIADILQIIDKYKNER